MYYIVENRRKGTGKLIVSREGIELSSLGRVPFSFRNLFIYQIISKVPVPKVRWKNMFGKRILPEKQPVDNLSIFVEKQNNPEQGG